MNHTDTNWRNNYKTQHDLSELFNDLDEMRLNDTKDESILAFWTMACKYYGKQLLLDYARSEHITLPPCLQDNHIVPLSSLPDGAHFATTYGTQFTKLGDISDGTLCLSDYCLSDAAFNSDTKTLSSDLDNQYPIKPNCWSYAPLRATVVTIANDHNIEHNCSFARDLRHEDGARLYSNCWDIVSMLTTDEYRRYRHLIPHIDKSWWTITADNIRNQQLRVVAPDGSLINAAPDEQHGVRLAVCFNPDTLVEVIQ